MKIIFWFSVLLVFYTYLGYPFVLIVLRLFCFRKLKKNDVHKDVSVVVAVRDEESNIKNRLDNLFSQEYQTGAIEVIVVSDGSIDLTERIVKDYQHLVPQRQTCIPDIKLISYYPSQGKSYALNLGVEKAHGEIIVFTDARQEFDRKAISVLVSNFSEPSVGCVSGELVFRKISGSSIKEEMGIYWNFEKYIRRMESTIHSLPGATGAIYAIRKSLFTPIPTHLILDDVYTPMQIVFKGYRAVFENGAIAYDNASPDFEVEQKRKIRTLVGNWQLLKIMPNLLNPVRNPIFFQYLSHKVMRLIVPFCVIAYSVCGLFVQGIMYKLILFLTFVILLIAITGRYFSIRGRLSVIFSFAKVLVNLNYYALLAFWYFIIGKQKDVWRATSSTKITDTRT